MRTTQRISVRDLVEFLLRSGDLDRRQSSGRRDAAGHAGGSRIHRKLQKQMGSGYQAEVTLKYQILLEDIPVSVEGRADGIWTDENGEEPLVVIDEIKGTLLGSVPDGSTGGGSSGTGKVLCIYLRTAAWADAYGSPG